MRRVLIVGDASVCDATAAALRDVGIEAVIGHDAHANPEGESPALVLVTMPALEIEAAIERARRADGVPVVPVVFGPPPCPGCLRAPFKLSDLLDIVRVAIGDPGSRAPGPPGSRA